MATTVGVISYDVKLNLAKLKQDVKESEKIVKGSDANIQKSANKTGGALSDMFGKVAVAAKVAGAAVGVAFTAAIGKFVIGGGISRALNIEDAQAKLRGLGHDAEAITTIMESALASVKGTAFGLDAAATIAASAVAAGIKPGQELTKYLGTTADAATIAGVSLSEMGSIFNKVQTGQRAYTMELNQLADRGIPIYQWLQEELGLSQEALRDMVSDGKLDSATYFKVIEKNIGGAALESGRTTRGAWANMQAAMARVGAAIVKDIIPRVRDSFGSMTKWFDDNSDSIVASVGKAVEILKDVAVASIEVGRQVGEYLAPKLKALWQTISDDLIPVLSKFWKSYLEPLVPVIGTVLVIAIGAALDILNVLITAFASFGDWINNNQPIVMGLASAFIVLKGAMILNAAFAGLSAGFNLLTTTTIPAVMAKMTALKLLVTTPMIMPAIAVAAAITAIALVAEEGKKLQDILNEVDRTTSTLGDAREDYGQSLKRRFERGEITAAERARLWKESDPGINANGTDHWKGGPTWVGERGPEIVNLPKGSQVVPNHKTSSGGAITISLNMSGVMARSRTDLRDIAKDMIGAINEELRAKRLPQIGDGNLNAGIARA